MLAQDTSIQPGINKTFQSPDLDVQQWVERFEREGREVYDKRNDLLAFCQVESDMDVADVGTGTGLFARLFAKKVGPQGKVYAVDIAEKFIDAVQQACQAEGLGNVTGVVCTNDDAKLPPNSIDLAFICDTYHHFEYPVRTMTSLHRALRPGGHVVVVDFKRVEGESSQWILDHVRAGQEVFTKEIESCGFELVSSGDFLTDNYVLRFRKADKQAHVDWQPVEGQLMTRWAREVSPDNVWRAYPRPQMVRSNWTSLNGLWDYAVVARELPQPSDFQGQILVPFPIESALSGVKKSVGPDNRLWYRRAFDTPQAKPGDRLLLHFGAVDWQADIWVNGRKMAQHQGGYDPFTVDITDALVADGPQELVVSVWDPTDSGFQPRGKQVRQPRGIWYTAVTGIWQTVWLEQVPPTQIQSLQLTPDVDNERLRIQVDVAGPSDDIRVVAEARAGEKLVADARANTPQLALAIPNPRRWSPDDPFLYDLDIRLERGGRVVDRVASYFGMRKIEVRQDEAGFNRLFLNDEPLFQFGPLDQGWWPDGLYTPASDEALRYDLEVTKRLGFNMIRKHVKVEPSRWYYHCDRLGLMVWQDLPNGDKHIGRDDPDLERSEESDENFRREYRALIDTHYNHPCIVTWVPFNEGWGQFATNEILDWTKQYDPTRLVDAPSGWADRGGGDMRDMHSYPGPGMPEVEPQRAVVLGEFGGLGLPIEGHLWWDKRNWGYRTYEDRAELQQNYEILIQKLRPLISAGLAAAVYTQTTDVEGEVNGLMTYDRAVIKYDAERLAKIHARLYLPPPIIKRTTVVPTSEKHSQTWRYTTEPPSAGWTEREFDDASWNAAPGGFGRAGTPGSVIRTPWTSDEIWVRRQFELPATDFAGLHLRIHHDEDAVVYLNGHRVVSLSGYTTGYEEIPLTDAATSVLRQGANTLAVHCLQTDGGQYIDVGLVDIEEQARPADD
jgi:predicted methyltransferase